MKNLRKSLRIWLWRARYWISFPLWWLLEPRAETLCQHYTDGLVDQRDYDLQIGDLQSDVSNLEGDIACVNSRVDDLEGELA